jgi:hypothetical protein
MQITGKLIKVLPLQSGISKTGSEWKKQDFVIETEGAYPKTVCFFLLQPYCRKEIN